MPDSTGVTDSCRARMMDGATTGKSFGAAIVGTLTAGAGLWGGRPASRGRTATGRGAAVVGPAGLAGMTGGTAAGYSGGEYIGASLAKRFSPDCRG